MLKSNEKKFSSNKILSVYKGIENLFGDSFTSQISTYKLVLNSNTPILKKSNKSLLNTIHRKVKLREISVISTENRPKVSLEENFEDIKFVRSKKIVINYGNQIQKDNLKDFNEININSITTNRRIILRKFSTDKIVQNIRN